MKGSWVRVETNFLIDRLKKALTVRKEVAAIYLFGSYGSEYQTQYSDIDLGVIFQPNMQIGLREELELDAYLSMALKTDRLDVVNLARAPIQLRYKAVAEGRLIYEADYITTSDFLEKTYRHYLDYAYHLRMFEQERIKALKEAYTSG